MTVVIQSRGDTAANWTSNNPTLETREIGLETDTGKLKVGDGATAWTSLDYWPGRVVQIVETQDGAVATGTGVVPLDDTIPQNTEGDQYMSLSITPTNASNLLQIDVNAILSNSAAAWMTLALFQDSTANAIASTLEFITTGTGSRMLKLSYTMTAGTTSATTFKARAGATGGTTTFNGTGGARRHGGVLASTIIIKEYTP